MKPTITAVGGPDGVSASNMDQSIPVAGTGFVDDMVVLTRSVDHTNRSGPPVIQVAAKGTRRGILVESPTLMDVDVSLLIDSNGPAQMLVFSQSNGIASDWFSFTVK